MVKKKTIYKNKKTNKKKTNNIDIAAQVAYIQRSTGSWSHSMGQWYAPGISTHNTGI